MDVSGLGGMNLEALNTRASQTANNNSADKLTGKINGLGKNSSDEELVSAVKSFESYFVEQMLKEFKETESFFSGDSDSSSTQYTDIFLDSTISDMAAELVDKYGDNLTDQLVEQMKMTYGIADQAAPDAAEGKA